MSHRVFVSEQAMNDIVRNARWWGEYHSEEQALRWYEAILAKIYALDTFPESHPIARETDAFSFELREMLFGLGSRPGYRVLFTIGKDGNEDAVHVLTVKAAEEDFLQPGDLQEGSLTVFFSMSGHQRRGGSSAALVSYTDAN